MRDTSPTVIVSPRVGALLTQVTETPDLETALWKILSEYIDLKTRLLRQCIHRESVIAPTKYISEVAYPHIWVNSSSRPPGCLIVT